MKLNQLRPARGATHKRKRLGCGTGSGHGGTSGRGHKGQKARAGGNRPAWFEGGQMPLQRRIPMRGFENFTRTEYQVVNVGDLSRFDTGRSIGIDELIAARLIRKRTEPVKLLARGEVTQPLTVRVHAASRSAIEKIGRSGGTVELLWPAQPEPPRDKRGRVGKRSRVRKPAAGRAAEREGQPAGGAEE